MPRLPISPLDPQQIRLMAAGEVLDSLGSVLRELIANALDAGSKRIEVDVDPELWQVRVSDDGLGIPGKDLALAAGAHTSSKLNLAQSLGFRGEALHSMAQLGSLVICSWAQGDPHGWRAAYDSQGSLASLDPVAMSRGTVVMVSDLFAGWPLRREAGPTGSSLVRKLQAVVVDAALLVPGAIWGLTVAGRERLRLAAVEQVQQRIPQLLPRIHSDDLRSGSVEGGWHLVVGLPDRCHRPRPDWVKIAVNGRVVQVPELEQTVQAAFQHTLPRHRHPLCVAHLQLDPQQVDWNRDPGKTTLYLQNLEEHQASLLAGIQAVLKETGSASKRVMGWFRAQEERQSYQVPASLPGLKVLAQLQQTYILVEHASGLWLIEQHVAHERVRYEQLCRQWQIVDLPQAVLLADLSHEQVQRLVSLGLDPEPFGDNRWRVQRIPAFGLEDADRWGELLQALSTCVDLDAARILTACRTAIRNGIPLPHASMQALVQAWAQTANPHTCPHGRPICLQLNEVDLARFFRRSWSICAQGVGDPGRLGDLLGQEIRGRDWASKNLGSTDSKDPPS